MIVKYVFRFDISMAYSMLMKICNSADNAINNIHNSWFRNCFILVKKLSKIMIRTILTDHINFFQFLIYKQVICFDNIFMAKCFFNSIVLFDSLYTL